MDEVGIDFLETQTVKPLVWNESEEKLEECLENLNNFHPYLKFTSEKCKKSVNFLDVTVRNTLNQIYIASQLIVINFLILIIDKFVIIIIIIIIINSVHPIHIKKSIMYSQGLCIKILCPSNIAVENHLESLKGWFQNRGYPKIVVDNQLKRDTETRQTSDQTYKRGNGVLLVLTYHPQLKNVNDIIKKHLVLSHCFLRCMQSHVHTQAYMQVIYSFHSYLF